MWDLIRGIVAGFVVAGLIVGVLEFVHLRDRVRSLERLSHYEQNAGAEDAMLDAMLAEGTD